MSQKKHYETLGVKEGASAAEIRAAYKRAAKEAHPDREGGDQERMSKINQAYGVLGHDAKRAHYDETGEEQKLDTLEMSAKKSLFEFINQALDLIDENQNFVAVVCMQLELNRQKWAAEKGKFEKILRAVTAHKKRLKRKKKGPNMLTGVFEEKQRMTKAKLANAAFTLKCIERGIEMMEDYETVFEEAAAARSSGLLSGATPFLILMGS